MTRRANVIKRLYDERRIGLIGCKEAVVDGIITKDEYKEITGRTYRA